jgi:DNA binding protein with HTH domain
MTKAAPMNELTFEVPIAEHSETSFLIQALKHIHVVHVLEFRSEGFLLVCRGSREEAELFRRSLSSGDSHNIGVTLLNTERSGAEILLVSGRWLAGEKGKRLNRHQTQEMEFFKMMERAPIYNLERPTFEGGKLRVSIIAHEKLLKQLLGGLDRIGVPYNVLEKGRPRAHNASLLNTLTAKQSGILRLAHTMGYYDVPRRTRTEDLAGLLQMDKGTVGEHLRRAEKHVFDRLLS